MAHGSNPFSGRMFVPRALRAGLTPITGRGASRELQVSGSHNQAAEQADVHSRVAEPGSLLALCMPLSEPGQAGRGLEAMSISVMSVSQGFNRQEVMDCARCLLGKDWLQAERILIRRTPYEIKVN